MSAIKIKLAQINFIVGDLDANCQKILAAYDDALKCDVDLVIFSELAITGYPPEDLLNKKYFLEAVNLRLEKIRAATLGNKTAILLGAPYLRKLSLYNSALLFDDGDLVCVAGKTCLPNYGVFDEYRYFKPESNLTNFEFRGVRLAILICEDIWHLRNAFLLGDKVSDVVISINASPFTRSKSVQRVDVVRKFIKDLKRPVIYVNQVGGQDAIVFDGGSFVMDNEGQIVLQMKEFVEDSAIIEVDGSSLKVENEVNEVINKSNDDHKVYNALIIGLRDYIHKNKFEKVVIGMSGGVDSALVAAIAVDALGSDNVKLVALPTRYNSSTSMSDAVLASENLNIKLDIINIEPMLMASEQVLREQFGNTKADATEENIQSRIRGTILMALSNKFGNLLLSTGNKSELAVGYATIYGDMCGAFNPLKDLYKTEVFGLAKWRNKHIPQISIYKKTNLIPQNIIDKAPTAELRENQKDSDSLPEYEILDKILYQLIEEEKSITDIINQGFAAELVKQVAKLFHSSEYKRRQAVMGVKVSEKSFDRDRRYSVTNQFNL